MKHLQQFFPSASLLLCAVIGCLGFGQAVLADEKNTLFVGLKEVGNIPVRPSSEIKDSRIGVGFEGLDRELFKPEKCYDSIAQTGAKWARCQTGWNRCEKVRGQLDFKWLDEVVDNLRSRGIEPWFNVGYGNQLYMPDVPSKEAVGSVPVLYGQECQEAWQRFLRELATHFKGRVRRYEIWNEPNLTNFWRPGAPSSKAYTRLVETSARVIKDADPDAFIIACVSGGPSQFLLDTLKDGIGKHINAYSIHPYSLYPELNYEVWIAALRAQLRQYCGSHVEIWLGECGCPSQSTEHNDEWLGTYNMDETKQAKWVLRRLLTDLSLGLENVSYFHAADCMEREYRQADGKVRKPVMMGLLNGKTYTPKKAFKTFSGICSLFDSQTRPASLFVQSFLNSERNESKLGDIALRTLTFERNGYPMYVYYLPEDLQLEMPPRRPVGLVFMDDAPRKIKEPVLVDLLQMKVFAIENMKSGQAIPALPVTDYPLIVTDRKALE